MYRIVGCILVVAAGAGMGFSGSMRLSEQIRILEKLLQMVICPVSYTHLRAHET